MQERLEVNDADPRRRRTPTGYQVGSSSRDYPATPKDFDHKHYFECLDLIIVFIFDQL